MSGASANPDLPLVTDPIEQVLADSAGVNVEALGRHALRRAVEARMAAHSLADPSAYAGLLRGSPGELEVLVEDLTVQETWFFRDRGPFEWLEQFARRRNHLRVLSAPCATGEEPYSIAITLLDAGLPPDRFQVDACDISQRALETAARAVYGAVSFREDWRDHRNRWFHPVERGLALRPEVAGLVRFQRDDLLHPVFLARQPGYDAVFCRNLLIYLRPEAQRALIERIGGLLRPDGIVVTGHAEVAVLLRHGYEAAALPRYFACRKGAPARAAEPARAIPRRPSAAPSPPARPDRARLLEWARQLGDQGALEDANSLCDETLRQEPDAAAYYLKGLISAARDRLEEADECFRRALYLDAAHYESLVQMSLICERRGEPARASLFRERAVRLAAGRTEAIDARRP